MNKEKTKFLNECIDLPYTKEPPILRSIYVIPTDFKHDSGYKIMYIIGQDLEKNKYILDKGCDVIDFESFWSKIKIEELHIDITPGGIIHIWNNRQNMKCTSRVSSCEFEMVGNSNE